MQLKPWLLMGLLLVLASFGSGRSARVRVTPCVQQQPAGTDSLAAQLRALLNASAASASNGTRPGPAVRAFYSQRVFAPAWCAGSQPNALGRAALALLAQAADYGLQPGRYQASALRALADSLG